MWWSTDRFFAASGRVATPDRPRPAGGSGARLARTPGRGGWRRGRTGRGLAGSRAGETVGARGWISFLLASSLVLGCARLPVASQRLVSKPNMVFSDSAIFSYQGRLPAQTEPGSAFTGGAQAAGCASCK